MIASNKVLMAKKAQTTQRRSFPFFFVKVISTPEWRYGNWDDGVILGDYVFSSLGVKSMLFGSMQ